MLAKLYLTDGTDEINLLSDGNGFYLNEWSPNTAEPKNGGVWQESPFVDGRQPVLLSSTNIVDTFSLGLAADSPDTVIYWTQQMRRMLTKASEYWTNQYTAEPVWIVAQAECETNPRYALVIYGRMPFDENPYQEPMVGSDPSAMSELTLVVEHQYWTAQEPKTAECVYLRNHNRYPWVMWINPSNDNANLCPMASASAVFDDLPGADFTCEMWLYGSLDFGAASGFLFWKGAGGWYVKVDAGRTISCLATYAGGNATLTSATVLPINPQGWTHIAATMNFAARTWTLWINGVLDAGVPVAGIGAYVTDVATDFYVGSDSAANSDLFLAAGKMTWTRISNNVRYAAPFVPVAYDRLPVYDANTICCTNGCKTFSGTGGNIAWTNPGGRAFPNYYTLNTTAQPGLGVQRYIENETSFYCDIRKAWQIGADREGCGIDYAFWADTSLGTYGDNIIDNNPGNWLPAAPAAGDFFYYGSGYYQGGAIPTDMVLQFAAADTSVYALEYYSSAGPGWAAVPAGSYKIDSEGTILCIQVNPPALNIPFTVNGYYGYWFRLNFTTAVQASVVSGPALISSPGIEITNESSNQSDIAGDVSAIARLGFHTELTHPNTGASPTKSYRWRAALFSYGIRDNPQGGIDSWFTPYINLCSTGNGLAALLTVTKPRNQPGIVVGEPTRAGPVIGTDVYDFNAPSGWCSQITALATTGYINVYLQPLASLSWEGRFRLFGRMRALTGTKGSVTVQASILAPYYRVIGAAQPIPVLPEIIDFGTIELLGSTDGRCSLISFILNFTVASGGPYDVNLYDLILWPADEWTWDGELSPIVLSNSTYYVNANTGNYVLLDPVIEPKFSRTAEYARIDTGATIPLDQTEIYYAFGITSSMSDKSPKLQTNVAQRLYLMQGFPYSVASNVATYHWPYDTAAAWTIEKVEQYESMRGNR